MKRSFASRAELHAYLQSEFPAAAASSSHLSPIRGGVTAAHTQLHLLEPARYGFSRNFLDGKVSRLSPYIRHGVLTLAAVKAYAFTLVQDKLHAAKFVTELAWRDYWQRLYASLGNRVWEDQEPSKTGLPPSLYQTELPADVAQARTGLACMDAFVTELVETGYLHNHARMWFAAYLVHWRKVRWQSGALFFLSHLLDGDPASNNLSWQWVASTFSHKPYFFNRENLEKYTASRYCRNCPQKHACPFEGSYESLSAKLFRIEVSQ